MPRTRIRFAGMKAPDDLSAAIPSCTISSGCWVAFSGGGHQGRRPKEAPIARHDAAWQSLGTAGCVWCPHILLWCRTVGPKQNRRGGLAAPPRRSKDVQLCYWLATCGLTETAPLLPYLAVSVRKHRLPPLLPDNGPQTLRTFTSVVEPNGENVSVGLAV